VHTISGTTTQKDYCGNVVYENGVQKILLTEEGYVDLTASTPTYYYYLKDHQGNNRVVINSSGAVQETNHYYPFGGVFASTGNVQPYKYNGKELDTKKGLNWYDYGARHYDAALGRWLVVDPLAEKYNATSVYVYCLNNPAKYVDPNGLSTWVMQNEDGTYRVVGGDLEDNDLSIYIVSWGINGMEKSFLGFTTSMTSFYNSDANNGNGAWAIGSKIDTGDSSGRVFIADFMNNMPDIITYMLNATGGEVYDFKTTNYVDNYIGKLDPYRGMPIGTYIYTSARDIGNMVAGYVAGVHNISWGLTRSAFDLLQSKQDGKQSIEGLSSQNAQYLGWKIGKHDFAFTYKPLPLFGKAVLNTTSMVQILNKLMH
jgi:RHS repeat-associated protein